MSGLCGFISQSAEMVSAPGPVPPGPRLTSACGFAARGLGRLFFVSVVASSFIRSLVVFATPRLFVLRFISSWLLSPNVTLALTQSVSSRRSPDVSLKQTETVSDMALSDWLAVDTEQR